MKGGAYPGGESACGGCPGRKSVERPGGDLSEFLVFPTSVEWELTPRQLFPPLGVRLTKQLVAGFSCAASTERVKKDARGMRRMSLFSF